MLARSLLVLAALALAGCTPLAGDYKTYESKAADAAGKVLSAVRSAELSARLASSGKASRAYSVVALNDADKEAASVRSIFKGIKPPDRRSAALGRELDPYLDRATASLRHIGKTAERDTSALAQAAKALAGVASGLEDFQSKHQ